MPCLLTIMNKYAVQSKLTEQLDILVAERNVLQDHVNVELAAKQVIVKRVSRVMRAQCRSSNTAQCGLRMNSSQVDMKTMMRHHTTAASLIRRLVPKNKQIAALKRRLQKSMASMTHPPSMCTHAGCHVCKRVDEMAADAAMH